MMELEAGLQSYIRPVLQAGKPAGLRTACGQAAALVHDVSTMSMLADAYLPTRVLRDVVEALYAVHLARLPTDTP